MRRANELGLGSVLLFAAAVSCCHAQASSDCALPPGLQSHGSADSFTAWDSAGTWFAQHKNLACATEAYNRALQIRPQSWRTLYDLGVVEVAQKRYPSAVLHLRRAVDLKPDSVDARNALGSALKDSGQPGRGRKAISRDSEDRSGLYRCTEPFGRDSCRRRSSTLRPSAIGIRLLSLEPENIDAGNARAIALSENGDQNASHLVLATDCKVRTPVWP